MIRYNKELKKNILDQLAGDSQYDHFEKLSTKHKIPIKTMKRWYLLQTRKQLNLHTSKKTYFQSKESNILSEKIIEKSLDKHCCLGAKEIKSLAKQVILDPDFKASNGWYFNFMKKSDLKEKIRIALSEAYIKNINQLQNINNSNIQQIKLEHLELATQNEETNNNNVTNQVRQQVDKAIQTDGLNDLICSLNFNDI